MSATSDSLVHRSRRYHIEHHRNQSYITVITTSHHKDNFAQTLGGSLKCKHHTWHEALCLSVFRSCNLFHA